jgi:REP element-mobilizing transposase RayT
MRKDDMNASKPNRRSIRLPDWDYRAEAYYFVTICTHQRQYLFDDPRLSEIAINAWDYIPQQPHARYVALDARIIMPDHMHGILHLTAEPQTLVSVSDPDDRQVLIPGSVGAIVGNYKMLVARRVKAMMKAAGTDMKVWQRGYWERIIRVERELNAIRKYIQENPLRWSEDRDNLDELLGKMRYVDGA